MSDRTPASDADFARAQRAVERGWLTKEQLEAAVTAWDREPGSRLLTKLALSPDKIRELENSDGAGETRLADTARPPARSAPPDEAAEAMKDPKNRVGRFVLLNLLGKGGMGMVFRGWEPELHQWVALKFLRQIDDTARAYFKREAQLAAGLDHPNIAKIYEIGEHDGRPFIAMQYVDGEPLSAAKKEMKLEAKIDAVRKIAEAVKYAHERSVIHRDLKPANVMVDRNGQVYVMDFGLAKETAVGGESLGGSSMVVGTPSYMSPEQAKGKANAQSDVYGVGAILYELVTGRPPFTGESSTDVMMQVMTQEPVWPRKLSPTTPEDVEAIILHALEKDPKRRYATAAELIADLEAYSQNNPLKSARRPTFTYVLGKRIRKQPLAWGFGAAMVIGIVGGAAFGTTELLRARREALHAQTEAEEKARVETQKAQVEREAREADRQAQLRLADEKDAAARKEAGIQKLAMLSLSIVERKQELRSERAPVEQARGRLEKALEEVGRYIRDWPRQPQGYYIRARGEMYLDDLDRAEADARKAIEMEPQFRPAWSLVGMIKIEQSYAYRIAYPDDLEAYPRIVKLVKEAGEAFGKGWQEGKEPEEAAKWGLPWSREDQVAVRLVRAFEADYVRENHDAAVQILQEGFAEYRAEEYAAELAWLNSDRDRKIALLTQAIELAPGYWWAYMNRGMSRSDNGDREGAIADYSRTIALRKDYAMAYNNRGSVNRQKGDLPGAIADFAQASALKPDEAIFHFNCASARLQNKDVEGAISDYDHAIALKGDYAPAYYGRGNAKFRKGDLDGAIADSGRALALKADYEEAFTIVYLARFYKGDLDGAMLDCDRAIKNEPFHPMGYEFRGIGRRLKGDYEGSVEDLTMALELDPANSKYFCERAWTHWQFDAFEKAEADYAKALEADPKYVKALDGRGWMQIRRAKYDDALVEADRALNIDPTHSNAYNVRGYAKLLKGDLDGSLAEYDRMAEIDPRAPVAFATRGYVKARKGLFEEAARDFAKSREVRNNPLPRFWTEYWAAAAEALRAKTLKGDEQGAAKGRALDLIVEAMKIPEEDGSCICHRLLKDHLKQDEDFEGLRENPRFKRLFEPK